MNIPKNKQTIPNLKEQMKAKGITGKVMAIDLKLSNDTISKVRNGGTCCRGTKKLIEEYLSKS